MESFYPIHRIKISGVVSVFLITSWLRLRVGDCFPWFSVASCFTTLRPCPCFVLIELRFVLAALSLEVVLSLKNFQLKTWNVSPESSDSCWDCDR